MWQTIINQCIIFSFQSLVLPLTSPVLSGLDGRKEREACSDNRRAAADGRMHFSRSDTKRKFPKAY